MEAIAFRGGAAFAHPYLHELLEAEGIDYAIRLALNQILQATVGHLLKRPTGRPPHHVQLLYEGFH